VRDTRRANSPSDDEIPEPRKKVGGDIRKRQLGDIAAILGGQPSKRQRPEGGFERREKEIKNLATSSDDESKVQGEPKSRLSRAGVENEEKHRSHRIRDRSEEGDRHAHKSDRRRHRSTSERRGKDERRYRRRETSVDDKRDGRQRRRSRSRSRSPREHRKKESRHRDRSPKRKRSESNESARERKSHRSRLSPSDPKVSERELKASKVEDSNADYYSDPLDEIIGPRPPPVQQIRSRGRGALSNGSGIDSRFSASYDPTVDVQLDPDEENDWDQALEALRDRQKLQKSGADRLRAAGFTEEEVMKWEKGGEKREEDVRWSKKGESREWDRGKVIDEDGVVTQEPSWGRLKDT